MPEVRCPVLVGREAEAALIEGAVIRGAGGDGVVVFVLGEAGVGKTRLATAAASTARDAGMTVLRGRATRSPAPLPYRPLAESLLSVLRGGGPPARPELERFGPALGVLVPAWAGSAGDRPAEPSVILLGEALLALLRSVADDSGAFVVLEDLHWADAGTLELLDYLADKLEGSRVVLVATSRAGEGAPAERLARQLCGRGDADVVDLARLPTVGVAGMVSATLQSAEAPAEVVAAVERASDGLPFLVEEILASLLATGSLVAHGGAWNVQGSLDPAVPPSFAALVDDRMAQLSSPSGVRGSPDGRRSRRALRLAASGDDVRLPDRGGPDRPAPGRRPAAGRGRPCRPALPFPPRLDPGGGDGDPARTREGGHRRAGARNSWWSSKRRRWPDLESVDLCHDEALSPEGCRPVPHREARAHDRQGLGPESNGASAPVRRFGP